MVLKEYEPIAKAIRRTADLNKLDIENRHMVKKLRETHGPKRQALVQLSTKIAVDATTRTMLKKSAGKSKGHRETMVTQQVIMSTVHM